MLHDPIQKCFLKPNIVPRLFAFDPLMPEDFLTLSEELLVEE